MQHVMNVVREGKEYDMEEFRKKAQERKAKAEEEKAEKMEGKKDKRIYPELQPDDGMGGPRRDFLKGREADLNLHADIGKRKLAAAGPVTAATAKDQAGWFCAVCDCHFKDSMTYVDHINGKKHQRMLGISMRVERQGVGTVMQKLEEMREKKNKDAAAKALEVKEKVAKRQLEWTEQEEAAKASRRDAKRRKKERERAVDNAATEEVSADDAMMKMMGFASFS
eukprot:TRINITY_DN19213_c0_g1_i1.p1 TRINITY_DN19213_c0_g1~~TRINITY_DN19213_c0_g1_i1.p1  ORF type:complete len:224 (+),score=109.04 TRINITY_DN19213_c0_g1_i1:90-761(+)